ncbi:YraN family protein [Brevibacterium ihuae]|uniref:YraN family protein n=1 Tax=Brevibacterium ihuae TaxID=1631743 RepID=UPI000C764DFE|nr:YraN family protein [Brevibacterium ihuae]
MDTMTLGRRGEMCARRHLEHRGWEILATNWRCSRGEIDIVARDGEAVVFVEVKTRATARAGHPLEAVTPRKLAVLRGLALRWLAAQEEWFPVFRVDVIGILWNRGAPELTHVRDAR